MVKELRPCEETEEGVNMIFFIGSFGLFLIGLLVMITQKNVFKILLGLSIAETGVHLFLITIGYTKGGLAPIIFDLTPDKILNAQFVDPVPQALILTSIVIGVAVLGLGLAFIVNLVKHYKTEDITKIKELKW